MNLRCCSTGPSLASTMSSHPLSSLRAENSTGSRVLHTGQSGARKNSNRLRAGSRTPPTRIFLFSTVSKSISGAASPGRRVWFTMRAPAGATRSYSTPICLTRANTITPRTTTMIQSNRLEMIKASGMEFLAKFRGQSKNPSECAVLSYIIMGFYSDPSHPRGLMSSAGPCSPAVG